MAGTADRGRCRHSDTATHIPDQRTGLGPSGGPIDIGHINDIADIDAGPQHPGHEVTGQEVTGQEVTGQEVTGQEGDREAKPGAQGDESPSLEPPTDLTRWM
jgi:hypothetical protein